MPWEESIYVNPILNAAVDENWSAFQFSLDAPGQAWKDGKAMRIVAPPQQYFWGVMARYKKMGNFDATDRTSQQSGLLRFGRQIPNGTVDVYFNAKFGPTDKGGYRMFIERTDGAR